MKTVVIDIEANGLVKPDKVWVIVCKDIDTGEYHVFREPSTRSEEAARFAAFSSGVDRWIGHNLLSYDLPVLIDLGLIARRSYSERSYDTLILSKVIDYPRGKHSLEDYGEEFGIKKGFIVEDGSVLESKHFPIWFYQKYSIDLENYCIRDVDITEKIFRKYKKYIDNPDHAPSIILEHKFQDVVNDLSNNGFSFNVEKAQKLLSSVETELSTLDVEILSAFPPKLKLIREITPKATKFGTISLSSIPKALRDNISEMSVDAPFCYCAWQKFNPSSHKQLIEVLNAAGWEPIDKTQTHIDTERELRKLEKNKKGNPALDLAYSECYDKLRSLRSSGWKINEQNLSTLPDDAPTPARLLARRILLESRRRTLTEWLELVQPDSRIHGKFQGIGAWTHRMSHQNPNTANIPTDVKLFGSEMRSLWRAPKNRLLVGVDAEGIQLRIFAHYIDDAEFTHALVSGKKSDKTDPHSLNQRILGSVCKSRQDAKRFIYALLLGAGLPKLAAILGCSTSDCEEALDRLLERYTGWARLKAEVIPKDAKRGHFIGLDGRKVRIPGDTVGERRHLCTSGYLQNGEAVCMKLACLEWYDRLHDLQKEYPKLSWKLVDFVHDEWQTEVNNDMSLAIRVAEIQAEALKTVGERLGLKCPLAGSYYNDDLHDYTIGTDWHVTH